MNKEKLIVAVVAFAVTFIFSAGIVEIFVPAPLVSQKAVVVRSFSGNAALEQFIAADNRNGALSRQRRELTESEQTFDYLRRSSALDASQFSEVFQNAWQDHLKAWRDFADFRQSLDGHARCPDEARARYFELNNEINRTWKVVISAARAEGANVTE